MFDPPKWLLEISALFIAIGIMSWGVTTAAEKFGVFD